MTFRLQADDFALNAAARIEGIKFRDFESPTGFGGFFIWQIYASDPSDDIPGALLLSGTSTNLSHVDTGNRPSGVYQEFAVSFDIPPVSLPAGKYWLALHNGPLTFSTGSNLYWEATSKNGTSASCERLPPFNGQWYSKWIGNWPELSFQLNGAPEPRVTAISSNPKKVSFTTTVNRNYRVEYKDELSDATWTTVPGADAVAGTGSVVQVADSSAGSRPRRFYHVLML